MSWVAQISDFKTFGLPAETWSPPSRQIQSVTVASSLLELPSHGFSGGESIRIAARGTGAALPTGLDATTFYTVAPPPNPDFFSLLAGSSPVTISGVGSGVLIALESMIPILLAILAARTSFVVANAKAYAAPWVTPPAWAPQVVCELAAFDFHAVLRTATPLYKVDDVKAKFDAAMSFCLDVLAKGIPMADGAGPVDATPTVADNGSRLARPHSGPFRAPFEPPGIAGPLGFGGRLGPRRDRV